MATDPPTSDLGAIRLYAQQAMGKYDGISLSPRAVLTMLDCIDAQAARLTTYAAEWKALVGKCDAQAARLTAAQAVLERFVEHPVPTAADFEAAEDWLSAGAAGAGEAGDGE